MARYLTTRSPLRRALALVPLLALLVLPVPAQAAGPLVLTTTLTENTFFFGLATAMSANGTTALVGTYYDNNHVGAAYAYTRSGNTWTQPGVKLIPTGTVGSAPEYGFKLALSADGITALITAVSDNNGAGAGFIFTRSGGVWTQQSKLTPDPPAVCQPSCFLGWGAALSTDGNTALIGSDNDFAYVFVRTGTTWTQQARLLTVYAGLSAALSADGNTALVGSPGGDSGATIFTRVGTVWTQQQVVRPTCNPTTGSFCELGYSVALSADGNTALVGAPHDDGLTGSAFVFTRSGGVWTQQGSKLTVPCCYTGLTVALSGDGNTALTGATGTLFTRTGTTWNVQQTLTNETSTGVALSGDATTALVGSFEANNSVGAAYIFTNPRMLGSIALSGTTSLNVGQVAQWQATGTFSDTTTGPLQYGTWQSSNPTVATVDASGNVTGQTAGTATITYTLDGVVGQLTVTVTAPNPIGISVPSAPQSRPSGATSGGGSGSPAPAPASRPTGASSATSGGTPPNPLPAPRP